MKKLENDRFIITVKVGPKGQITIPMEARKMFNIGVGDNLIMLGDKTKGLALMKATEFYDLMEGRFNVNQNWKSKKRI